MAHSREARPSAQPMYKAAARWRDECLIADRSLFSGDEIETVTAVRQLIENFVDQPDAGEGTFISKLEIQLADVDSSAVQMAAELLFVHFLIVSTRAMKGETKRNQVNGIASFRDQGTSHIPGDLEAALFGGVANPGTAYNTYRWKMYGYLIRVVARLKRFDRNERKNALASLDAFRQAIFDIDVQTAWSQKFALEHLLFPDEAAAIVSQDDREKILLKLTGDASVSDVESLVAGLQPNVIYGDRQGVNLYRSPYRQRWRGIEPTLQTYVEWARLVLDRDDFAEEEVVWKYARADEISTASKAILDGDDPQPHLKRIFGRADLVDFRVADDFVTWALENPQRLRDGLGALYASPGPAGIDRFLEQIPTDKLSTMGARLSIASLFLFATDPRDMPPWRAEPAKATIRLTDGYSSQQSATAGEHYLDFLERLDTVIDCLQQANGSTLDRLEMQGAAWSIAKATKIPQWSKEAQRAFLEWREGKSKIGPNDVDTEETLHPSDGASDSADVAMTIEDLAEALYFDDAGGEWLEQAIDLLRQKGQIILQGPPGTGKTHIARHLAEFVSGDDGVVLTQFHPGTAYEDFIQGLRPDPENHSNFKLVDGPFLRAAEMARAHPEKTVVVIIDEINRGNIPAVFGELYFLLEYRNQDITLNYGGTFRLPENLMVIGTMNTTDRSITAVDAALRRRFFTLDLRPGQTPVDGMLRTYLERTDGELWLADLLDAANDAIPDRDQHIGPTHLMTGAEREARRAWEYSVLPTLRETFYNNPDKWTAFDFDTLKGKVRGDAGDAATD
ncbi:McrB family protein [Arthrobacter pigmenti]